MSHQPINPLVISAGVAGYAAIKKVRGFWKKVKDAGKAAKDSWTD